MTNMALRPAAGFPSGGDLAALFDVLRSQAFTRAVDESQPAPRDGYGIADDRIHIEIDESDLHVRATTRTLRASREQAFVDAQELLTAIIQSGSWHPVRDGAIGVHPARHYTPELPTSDTEGWFGAAQISLMPD
jgi:hypothetical protein